MEYLCSCCELEVQKQVKVETDQSDHANHILRIRLCKIGSLLSNILPDKRLLWGGSLGPVHVYFVVVVLMLCLPSAALE